VTRGELTDRYGPLPAAVDTLLQFALLKSNAQKLGIEAVDRRSGWLSIKFHPGSRIHPERLLGLVTTRPGSQFTPAGVLRIPLPQATADAGQVLDTLGEALAALG